MAKKPPKRPRKSLEDWDLIARAGREADYYPDGRRKPPKPIPRGRKAAPSQPTFDHPLIAALTGSNHNAQYRATQQLQEMQEAAYAILLDAAEQSTGSSTQLIILKALERQFVRTRDAARDTPEFADAIRRLVVMVQDKTNSHPGVVAIVLGATQDARALPPLETAFEHTESTRKSFLLDALGAHGSDRAIALLEQAAQHGDGRTRIRAARNLGQLGVTTAVEILRVAFADSDATIRELAYDALRKIQPSDLSDIVLQAARDPNVSLRLRAVAVLRHHADREPVQAALVARVQDVASLVQIAAINALDGYTTDAIIESLTHVARRDPDPKVRTLATEALTKRGITL